MYTNFFILKLNYLKKFQKIKEIPQRITIHLIHFTY
jgi:hypothetical protein